MSLSKDDLRVSNTVYRLELDNNVMRRKKLSMVDSEGNKWYRYDTELWTFTVVPMTISGMIKQVIRGVVNYDSISEDEYHLQYIPDSDGKMDTSISTFFESDLINDSGNWDRFYAYYDEAVAAGETYCVNRNT